jgi:hypothetical protein
VATNLRKSNCNTSPVSVPVKMVWPSAPKSTHDRGALVTTLPTALCALKSNQIKSSLPNTHLGFKNTHVIHKISTCHGECEHNGTTHNVEWTGFHMRTWLQIHPRCVSFGQQLPTPKQDEVPALHHATPPHQIPVYLATHRKAKATNMHMHINYFTRKVATEDPRFIRHYLPVRGVHSTNAAFPIAYANPTNAMTRLPCQS